MFSPAMALSALVQDNSTRPSPPSHSMASNFLEILSQLHDRHVEFVIVGGVAAALHGGSRVTFDLDLVPNSTDGPWQAAVDLLWSMGARPSIPESLERIRDVEQIRRWQRDKGMWARRSAAMPRLARPALCSRRCRGGITRDRHHVDEHALGVRRSAALVCARSSHRSLAASSSSALNRVSIRVAPPEKRNLSMNGRFRAANGRRPALRLRRG
jgi:hypothetical protein